MLKLLLTTLILTPGCLLAAGIESFSPQGEAKEVRQVKVRFDRDMVPLGDPALAPPLTTDCSAPGAGRWVDSRNWVHEFRKDLPGGVRCRFTTRPGLSALNGEALPSASYAFHTGGPAIVTSVPGEG